MSGGPAGVPGPWAQATKPTTAITRTAASLGKLKRCTGRTLSDLELRDSLTGPNPAESTAALARKLSCDPTNRLTRCPGALLGTERGKRVQVSASAVAAWSRAGGPPVRLGRATATPATANGSRRDVTRGYSAIGSPQADGPVAQQASSSPAPAHAELSGTRRVPTPLSSRHPAVRAGSDSHAPTCADGNLRRSEGNQGTRNGQIRSTLLMHDRSPGGCGRLFA